MSAQRWGLALLLVAVLGGCGPGENEIRHFGSEDTGSESGAAELLSTPPIAGLRPPIAAGEGDGQVSQPPPGFTERLLAAPGQGGGAIIKRGSTSWLGSLF